MAWASKLVVVWGCVSQTVFSIKELAKNVDSLTQPSHVLIQWVLSDFQIACVVELL